MKNKKINVLLASFLIVIMFSSTFSFLQVSTASATEAATSVKNVQATTGANANISSSVERPVVTPYTGQMHSGTAKPLGVVLFKDLVQVAPGHATMGNVPEPFHVKDLSALAVMKQKQAPSSHQAPFRIVSTNLPPPNSKAANLYSGFDGIDEFTGGSFPPDTQMAVGPSHIVEMTNFATEIWTKSGTSLSISNLKSFFGKPSNHFVFDPKIAYDPVSGRWIALAADGTDNTVPVAVSFNSDPTAGFCVYPFQTFNSFPDQPILGFSNDKVVISANTDSGWQFQEFDKGPMLVCTTTGFQTNNPDPTQFSVHPVREETSNSDLYMVSVGAGGGVSSYELMTMSGQAGSLAINTNIFTIATTVFPQNGQQAGSANLLETGDGRMLDADYKVDPVSGLPTIWSTFADGCTPAQDSQQRSCIRLNQLDLVTICPIFCFSFWVMNQDFDFSQNGYYFSYSAVAMDGAGNLVVPFGYTSQYGDMSIALTGQLQGGFNNVDQTVNVVSGTGPSNDQFPANRYRWGDYASAAVDPSNTANTYVAGEYHNTQEWVTHIDVTKESSSISPHATTLTIFPIANPRWGQNIAIFGKLTDNDAAGLGIGGKLITWTGAAFINNVVTAPDGTFIATGTAPSSVANGWTNQAHYAGGLEFSASNSNIITYSTLKHTTSIPQSTPANVPWSGATIFTTKLIDLTTGGSPIAGRTISWTGTGVIGVAPAVTDATGNAVGTGTAPNTVNTGWTVFSHFAGDSLYNPSNTAVAKTYNTVAHKTLLVFSALKPTVPWGSTTNFPVVLTDSDNGGTPIPTKTITFTGTGVIGVVPQVTDAFGAATGTGTAPITVAAGWTVQAKFAGDTNYAPAQTAVRNYATIVHSTSLTLIVSPNTVVHGGTYSVSGTLRDTSANVVLASQPITFTATSPIVISSATTTAAGTYSKTGLVAPTTISVFNIQSHFAGTALYNGANSPTRTLTTT